MRTCLALMTAITLGTSTIAAAQSTAPADCRSDDYLEAAMAHLESHYRSFPEELFTAQLFLREGFDQPDVSPDGKWGPKTERAVCALMKTYTDIGGSDVDWGISRASHAPQFTNWLLEGARANLSDGEIDFPD